MGLGVAPRSRCPPGAGRDARLTGSQILAALLHVVELLAHLGQTRLQLVHRIVQRLNLAGELLDAAIVVGDLALHLGSAAR